MKKLIGVALVIGLFLLGCTTGQVVGGENKQEGTTFTALNNPVEKIDGKPVIRLYSTTWCPHCVLIKDTFDSVMKEYVDEGKISKDEYPTIAEISSWIRMAR